MGSMDRSTEKYWWGLAGVIVAAIFLLPFVMPGYRQFIEGLIRGYPHAGPFVIIVTRFLAVVLAPLPGAPVALASLLFFEWWEAWVYNFIGSTAGVVSAFWIARKYREPVVARFAPLEKIHHWQERVSKRRQFWTFAALRLAATTVFDFVSYAAGLTTMSFRTFVGAVLLVDIPVSLVFFYIGGVSVQYGVYVIGIAVFVFAAVIFALKYLWPEKPRA